MSPENGPVVPEPIQVHCLTCGAEPGHQCDTDDKTFHLSRIWASSALRKIVGPWE